MGSVEKSRKDYIIDKILDFIIYGGLITVIIWGILKGIGVINTPSLLQQLPLIAGSISLLGFAYKIGRYIERIEQKFHLIDIKFNHIDKDLEFLKQRV